MIASIPKSGIYFPNLVGSLFLRALEDELGRTGVSAVMNLAGFPSWLENGLPEDLKRELDLNVFSKISASLEEMYGPRSGRAIARRIGWDMFHHIRKAAALRFVAYRFGTKLIPGRRRMAAILLDTSRFAGEFLEGSIVVGEKTDELSLSIQFCPVCWGRKTNRPICYLLVGILEEGMRWMTNAKEVNVIQTECSAAGDDRCTFRFQLGSEDSE